jgi:electron transfer flavoprotein beta subunit
MDLFVLLKTVPDTVEELSVAADNKSLDAEWLRFRLSDADEHAVEQALLLKEKHGGKVTVVALDSPEVDEALYAALAKGADRAVKIPVDQTKLGSVAVARVFAEFLAPVVAASPCLVLPGCQAIDDLEGELGSLLAEALHLPYVGVVCGVSLEEGGNKVVVLKEFAGGVRGEFELSAPALLGIQSAEKPPRYVPVAKVRAVMKAAQIETAAVAEPDRAMALDVERMYKPEAASHAEMLEGSAEEIAAKLADILAERGIV